MRRPFSLVRPLQGRVSHELAVRQARFLARPLWLGRIMTLPLLVTTFSASDQRVAALLCAVPALLITAVRAAQHRPYAPAITDVDRGDLTGRPVDAPPTRSDRSLRDLLAWADILSAQLLVFASAWLLHDLTRDIQFGALLAAEVLLIAVTLRAVLEPDWYRPGEPYPVVLDWLRAWAGPIGAVLSAALAYSGAYVRDAVTAVDIGVIGAITLGPLLVSVLTNAQDEFIAHITGLIRQEAQDGRQMVLDETHGALSTTLRLLEQRARDERERSPRLYELAVVANSGLRETLTLADPEQDTPHHPETLRAVVSTPALAVGAAYTVRVGVGWLGTPDRDAARVVLSEMVGLVLSAGASSVAVHVDLFDHHLVVRVEAPWPPSSPLAEESEDGVAPPTVPCQSQLRWLDDRLARIGGSVHIEQPDGHVLLTARWPVRPGTESTAARRR